MTVKRYTPTQCCEHDGTYVTYSDYQKLVAENSAMRNALSGVMTHCPINAPDIDKACAAMICNHALQSAPATDAAIAEIKSEEAQNMYESILDNPSVYDMVSLVDYLESYAENKKAFSSNLRAGRKG